MIYLKRTEKNLVNSTEAVVNKKIDYTDTLTFRVPVNEDILVEDILIVKSRIVNQQYRVHEITAKGMFKEVFCKHVFFDIEKVVIDNLPIGGETDIEDFARHLNLKLKEKRLGFKVDVDTLKRSKALSQGAYSISDEDYKRTLDWAVNIYRLNSSTLNNAVDEYLRETNQSTNVNLKNDMVYSFTHLLGMYARSYCYLRNLEETHLVNGNGLNIPEEEIEKRETMYKSSSLYKNIVPILNKFLHQGKNLLRVLSETTVRINYVENSIDKYRKRKANISVNDTNLYNLIFAEKGVLNSFGYKVVWDNYKFKFVNSVIGNNTEILFHEKKNISDMQNSASSKPLVTRLYVTCKYKEDKNSEEYKQKQAEQRRIAYENKTNEIEARYAAEDAERARKRALSDSNRGVTSTKRTSEQVSQDIIEKRRLEDAERERKRQLAREKRASTFNAREEAIANKEANKQAAEEARTFKITVESPLINFYTRVYEDTITFESSEIQSVEQLEEYCKHHFFNEDDTRDVPTTTFSFTPVQEELRISLYDYARVVFDSLERVNKVVQCVEIKYDPINDKYINVEFGDATTNVRASQMSKLTESIKSYVNDKYSGIDNAVSEMEYNFNKLLEKEQEAFDLMFEDRKTEFELELENNIKEAELKVIEQNGVLEQQLNTKIEAEANKSKELIDNFKQTFNSEKQDLLTRISDVNSNVRDFESKIADANRKANELVNNISISARNYVKNSDFSSNDRTIWRDYNANGFNIDYVEKDGMKAVKMWSDNVVTQSYYGIQQLIKYRAKANEKITVSLLAAKDNDNTSVLRVALHYNKDGAIKGQEWKYLTITNDKLSDRYTFEFTVPSDVAETDMIKLMLFPSKDTKPKIYISQIMLQSGTVKQDYLKAVEDYNHEIEQLNNGYREKFRQLELKDNEFTEFKNTSESTVEGFRQDISRFNSYIEADGTRQSNILSLAEIKTAELINREMTNLSQNYVANSVLNETVQGIDRMFSEIKVGGTNLLKGTKDFTGNWEAVNNWVNDGHYENLTVKSRANAWAGIYQRHAVKNGDVYTFSGYLKKTGTDKIAFYNLSGDNRATVDINSAVVEGVGETFKRFSVTFKVTGDGFICPRFEKMGNNGKLYVAGLKLEKGTIHTDWSPAPEDGELIVDNKIATFSQGINGRFDEIRGIANDGKALATRVEQDLSGIRTSVSSLSGDVFKKSEFRQTDDKITLATGYEIDGRKLGSMISLSPDGIKAVTDKMIITADNENLIPPKFRNRIELRERFYWFGARYKHELKVNDEFYFDFNSVLEKKGGIQGWYIGVRIHYTDNSDDWVTKWCGFTGGGVLQGHDDNGPETLKIPTDKLNSAKVVEYWEPYLLQNSNSDFATVRIENLKLYKKKSAELIVDGSILAKHIDADSVRTSILTANSITSTMLDSDVILAKHLKVDEAIFNKIFGNELMVNDGIVKNLFAKRVQAVNIDASKITSGVLGVGVRLGIGTTGYIEPYETGVRTVIPTEGSKGVAIHQTGNAHGDMEKGVNIYNLDDTVKPDNPELKYNETLLTVHGQVKIGLPLNSADVGGSDTRTLLGYAVGTNTANNTPVKPVGFTGDGTYNPTFSSIRWVGWFWGSTFGSRIAFDHGSKNNFETFMVRVAESYSDIKLKKNIEKSDVKALDIIENLKFKQFDWNDESKLTAGQPHVKLGLIAQEVELLASDLVTQANKYKELEHFKLTMYALKAIQELSEKINRLEKIINEC